MGIENGLPCARSCPATPPHYPHGDRKPACVRCRTPRVGGAHYPSWGSKTPPSARCWGAGRQRLITPHGDRKRDVPARSGLEVPPLITPHGDRKLNAQQRLLAMHNISLPLMGIENVVTEVLGSTAPDNSLPLMGIENHWPTICHRYSSGSLPLMGIENEQNVAQHDVAGGLITPHGDRKRGGTCPRVTADTAHYPSWGSKTPDPLGQVLYHVRLITPHGDRKRRW